MTIDTQELRRLLDEYQTEYSTGAACVLLNEVVETLPGLLADLEQAKQVAAQLVLQRAELVAALEWYADGDHYGDEDEDGRVPIEWDWGERAREALRRVRG